MQSNIMVEHEYGIEYDITFRRVGENDVRALNDFDCGNESINEFIRNCVETKKDVTYLFVDNENDGIIGFCSICCNGISINATDGVNKFNTNFPAVEIDFFAIDERYKSKPFDEESSRHETLSNALFLYMIGHINDVVISHVGATHLCLYAVPQAVSFYKRCGFNEFEEYMNPDEAPFTKDCIPMFMTL